ncbi:hypothetical protein [Nonomuraea guangzhouensis]|uniref:Uncharacterized protein n=1 Tax=Nonomuraea guangzhouensis TaxID=1291555 RepID=A0ABW4GQZ5_9ACTN|nr:hypothetical protein [Nonomuraea guangzhouensis]
MRIRVSSIERIKASRPDLRFHIGRMLADADRIAVCGRVRQGPDPGGPVSRFIWLADGRPAGMWACRSAT